jgi:hypothetical protein
MVTRLSTSHSGATIRLSTAGRLGDSHTAVNTPDGGGDNPYVPNFTDLNVVPDDLAEFADLLDADLKAIMDTWARLKSEIDSQADTDFPGIPADSVSYDGGYRVLVYTGPGGIYEAREFHGAYERTVLAKRLLMEDLIRGLETLRDAARRIHHGYVTSDAASADHLEGAFEAYDRSAVIDAFREPDEQT